MRIALQRLQRTPAAVAAAPPAPPGLPGELERVLRYLEGLDPARLGSAAEALAKRLKRIAETIQARVR
jgi:hypothetical protein